MLSTNRKRKKKKQIYYHQVLNRFNPCNGINDRN